MQAFGTTRMAALVLVLATGVLIGCGGADDEAPETSAPREVTDPDPAPEVEVTAAADPVTGSSPAGRLVLGGEDYPLTFDADDPNAICQVLAVGAITVSGMRTPAGNRVDITITSIPRANVMATYYDDDEVTLWSIATDGSSVEPAFEAEGSTASVSGLWFNRQDPSLGEIEGELEVTC